MLRKIAWVILAALVVIVAVVVIDWISGPSANDQKNALEELIRNTLPDQASQISGTTVTVSDVSCVDQDDGQFRCIATISDETASNIGVPIDASCDDEACEWHLAS